MVRDLESLIEYLYLRSINSRLLDSRIIVNPKESDKVLGKIVIINKIYEVPDLTFAEEVINRSYSRENYNSKKNPYISGVGIQFIDSVFVFPKDNVFYFGLIPREFLKHPCYKYLFDQISNYSDLGDPIKKEFLELPTECNGKTEESSVSKP